jgi:branched-chain amino acid transport system substrate-binding protein
MSIRSRVTVAALTLTVALSGLVALTAATAQAASAQIKVGMVCSCSGVAGSAFSPIADAYQAWVNTINKSGGINGHKVDFILQDDGSSPSKALIAADALLSDGVVSIYDNSLGDQVWLSKVAAANVPIIGQYANNPANPDVFVPGTTTKYGAPAEVALAKASHATKLGQFYCVELASCTSGVPLLKQAVAQTTGVTIAYTTGISLASTNFTSQCLAAQQAGVTALIPSGAPANIEGAAASCTQQGYKPVYIQSGTAWAPVMGTDPGLKDNTWLSFSQYPYFVTSQPGIKALDAAIDKYYPGVRSNPNAPSGELVNAWASGTLLKDALQAGGLQAGTAPTTAVLLKGLYTMKNQTLGGLVPPLTFKKGQIHDVNCWFEGRWVNGTPHLLNGGQLTCAK